MTTFPLWAERLYNRPVALDRLKNDTLCEFAEQRIFGVKPERMSGLTAPAQMRAFADEATFSSDGGRKKFMHRGNVAVVPVRGTLVHKGGFMDAESGMVGYNWILEQLRAAKDDSDIKGIFMPWDSGGGETAGMFAAAEEIASMSAAEGGKPIYSYLDERACSAAYVLASAGDKIYGRRESMGGSIAALCNMVDKSKAFEKMGLKPIVVRATWADLKAKGQPGEEIDAELVVKMREIVDHASDQVAEFVAAMRGIPEKAIRDLRGEVFLAEDLLELGLIDGIASEQEAWAMLEAELVRA